MKQLPVCLMLLAALAVGSPPVVENVRFEQLPNSNLVEITYNLSDADGDDEFTVTFEVSTDGGRTWGIKPERWSGDAGSEVKAGGNKRIVWDAYGDCGELRSSRVKIRVKADDGRLPKVKPKPKPRPEPKPQPPTLSPESPRGMKFLCTNNKGYEEYLWLKDSSVMVKVPAGEFWMGSPPGEGDGDEGPQHKVYVSEFYVDKHEVTNRQFERFVRAIAYRTDAEKKGSGWVYDEYKGKWVDKKGVSWRDYYDYATEKHPVVLVSWNDARAYCKWVGKQLPTEAEWEKAARGIDARKYPWGSGKPTGSKCNFADRSADLGWSDKSTDDGYARTAPVGTYPQGVSPYGCMDMAGNVWEWCNDW